MSGPDHDPLMTPFEDGLTVYVDIGDRHARFTISASQLLSSRYPVDLEHMMASSVYKAIMQFEERKTEDHKLLFNMKMGLHGMASKHPHLAPELMNIMNIGQLV